MPIATTTSFTARAEETAAASRIFLASHASVVALHQAYWTVREARGNPLGAASDQEQDILRAMLVMACSGLDAILKQLIRDCIGVIAAGNPDVQKGLETFVERKIRAADGSSSEYSGTKFIAKILCAQKAPVLQATDAYIFDLTGDSLQSADQVLRVAQALGIRPEEVGFERLQLREIFRLRNAIIHELDVNLAAKTMERNTRNETSLSNMADRVLALSRSFVTQADNKVRESQLTIEREMFGG